MTTLMIVDDAAFMRMSIKQMIENKDFDVIAEAADGLNLLTWKTLNCWHSV